MEVNHVTALEPNHVTALEPEPSHVTGKGKLPWTKFHVVVLPAMFEVQYGPFTVNGIAI